jgi:hypothetical protein
MRVAAEGLGNDLLELGLDFIDILAGRETGAVADAEDVRVDCERLLPESGVEDDVGSLSADSRKLLELFAGARDLTTVPVDERLRQSDDVLRLGVEQANGLYRAA